ncbi:MAG: hypothetical protein J6A21_08895 [Lentisphaeria bacterium]|nr:hypothetical protein [Lentisphaeria bacterium]
MKRIVTMHKGREKKFSSVLFLFLVWFLLLLLSSCTDYERAGLNPRPFNEPAYWEINPYGPNAFQN